MYTAQIEKIPLSNYDLHDFCKKWAQNYTDWKLCKKHHTGYDIFRNYQSYLRLPILIKTPTTCQRFEN